MSFCSFSLGYCLNESYLSLFFFNVLLFLHMSIFAKASGSCSCPNVSPMNQNLYHLQLNLRTQSRKCLVFIFPLLENVCCFPTVLGSWQHWVNCNCACYTFKPSSVISSDFSLFVTLTFTLTLWLVQCFRELLILERAFATWCLHNQKIFYVSQGVLHLERRTSKLNTLLRWQESYAT